MDCGLITLLIPKDERKKERWTTNCSL